MVNKIMKSLSIMIYAVMIASNTTVALMVWFDSSYTPSRLSMVLGFMLAGWLGCKWLMEELDE